MGINKRYGNKKTKQKILYLSTCQQKCGDVILAHLGHTIDLHYSA